MSVQNPECVRVELGPAIARADEEQASKQEKITRPLVSFPNLKIVAVSMPQGGVWSEHSTPGRISVQCLRGHIRMKARGETFDLRPMELLALEGNVQHDVEAVEQSVFLLTVARCD